MASTTDRAVPTAHLGRAWALLLGRVAAVLALTVASWAILRAATGVTAFPPSSMWATLALMPINIACLIIVVRLYRAQGVSLREALGVQRGRVGRDIAWGLLWLVVLNVPFGIVVAGSVFAMYGADAPAAFETLFFDIDSVVPMDPALLLVLAIVSVVPFMLINAPTEELVFRGYALSAFASRWGGAAAVLITAVVFGAQHVLFAASVPGMLVYFLAFTVWGLGAAMIVCQQGRLLPVVIAHWIINILMSAPALVLPVLQLTGVVEA